MTAPLAPGERIAPGYEVLAHLHRGRALDVYDVWSDRLDARCIAKTARPDRQDARTLARIEREASLMLAFAHPHIVRAYELVHAPHPVLVMETLGGQTLAHLLDEHGRLPARDVAILGLHLCSAVGYMHRRGVLHLDLKPSNIVVEGGTAKLLDLSIARRPGRGQPGVGTWCYMAPEQADGRPLTRAADVWGIGVVLHEAATGRPAFDDPAPPETSSLATDDPPPSAPQATRPAAPLSGRRGISAALAAAVDPCLLRAPAARPSLPELAARLAAVRGVPSTRGPGRRPPRRHGGGPATS